MWRCGGIVVLACLCACDNDTGGGEPVQTIQGEINIGVLAPLTGSGVGFNDRQERAMRLAVSEINAAGGVNGKRLGYLLRDSKLATPVAREAVRRGFQELADAGVVAVVGPLASAEILNVLDLAIANNLPLISPGSTSPRISTVVDNDLVWRTAPSDAFQGAALAQLILAQGHRSLSVIHVQDAYGDGLADVLVDHFLQGGGSLLARVGYPDPSANSFDTEVTQAFANGRPDALALVGFIGDTVLITQGLARLIPAPLPALFGVDANGGRELLQNAPPEVVIGMRGTTPVGPTTSANYLQFRDAYQAVYGVAPSDFTESSYDAVYLIALALTQAQENSRAAVQTQLRAVSRADSATPVLINIGSGEYARAVQNPFADLDFQGASGSINFDSNGDVTGATYALWEVIQGSDGLEIVQREIVVFP